MAIACCLRFGNLTFKTMWGDEWATLVFSLGSGFDSIPFDQIILTETLLAPLKVDISLPVSAVTESLLRESNHPPLYFWLTNLWLRLLSPDQQYVSIWAGRSLSALCGVLLIPLGFWLGWLSSHSRRLAHLTALVFAFSPTGVYLAQEARHYSFALIWVCLSIGCLIILIRGIKQGRSPSFLLLITWLMINAIGVASHFFVALHIWVEGLVLLWFYLEETGLPFRTKQNTKQFFMRIFSKSWRYIMLALAANIVMILIQLNAWSGNSDDKLTSWLNKDYGWSLAALEPIGRLILWLWGMLFNFPLEVQTQIVFIPAAIAMVGLFLWLSPQLIRATRQTIHNLESRIFLAVIISSIFTFFGIIYLAKLDVSLTPRYQFIYLPAVLLLFATLINHFWEQQKKRLSISILLLMLIGALSVNFDWVYRKPDPTTQLTHYIRNYATEQPLIIASRDHRAAEIRVLMGIAWKLHHQPLTRTPNFFILGHDNGDINSMLTQLRATFNKEFELWMVNTSTLPLEEETGCDQQPEPRKGIPGTLYRRYLCH